MTEEISIGLTQQQQEQSYNCYFVVRELITKTINPVYALYFNYILILDISQVCIPIVQDFLSPAKASRVLAEATMLFKGTSPADCSRLKNCGIPVFAVFLMCLSAGASFLPEGREYLELAVTQSRKRGTWCSENNLSRGV